MSAAAASARGARWRWSGCGRAGPPLGCPPPSAAASNQMREGLRQVRQEAMCIPWAPPWTERSDWDSSVRLWFLSPLALCKRAQRSVQRGTGKRRKGAENAWKKKGEAGREERGKEGGAEGKRKGSQLREVGAYCRPRAERDPEVAPPCLLRPGDSLQLQNTSTKNKHMGKKHTINIQTHPAIKFISTQLHPLITRK